MQFWPGHGGPQIRSSDMIGHALNSMRTFVPRSPWVFPEFARGDQNQKVVSPSHCCVYCGHPLHVPPRTPQVHCVKCYRQMSAKDIVITGTVIKERFLTAGKITVAPKAVVTAELVACHIELAGEVNGTVLASHTCSIRRTGKHAGMLLTRYLNIQTGAILQSEIEIIRD